MTWYPDMNPTCMVARGEHVRAIGWLSDRHPFPIGDTPPAFLHRLAEFCQRWSDGLNSLEWPVFMGTHCCEFCGKFIASGNIGVPAGSVLFAAPEMVAHYVEVHRYSPPAEFVTAVMTAPMPGTSEYTEAVAAFGAVHLQQRKDMSAKA